MDQISQSACACRPFQRGLLFESKAGAFPSGATPLYAKLLALLANITLGSKHLPVTNCLAYLVVK